MSLNLLRLFCLIILILNLPACFSFRLPEPQPMRALSKLLLSNTSQISVQLQMPENFNSLGNQYLLLIPFTSIDSSNTEQHVRAILAQKLALCGYNFSLADHNSSAMPLLKLNFADISCSAFDLFFIRRIRCKIELVSQRSDQQSSYSKIKISNAQFKPYGFSSELLSCLHSTLNQAIDQALFDLRLCEKPTLD